MKKNRSLFVSYTLFFCVAALIVFSHFIVLQKSMVWKSDGLYQHYNAFIYLGTWCRQILRTLLTEGNFVFPMWEWGLGYGGDVLTTLSYYTFGDPFALISVITPVSYAEVGYAVSILLRFYTAGLAFCWYCTEMNCRKWSTVCASIVYIFCAYAIRAGVRHPYFTSPMIYFPLVLLGCEKLLYKKSPYLFIGAVALSAFSNYYFFYKIVLLTVVYVFVRLLPLLESKEWGLWLKKIFSLTKYAVLGLCLAAPLLLPNIIAFTSNSRISSSYTFDLFYSAKEYTALPGTFVGVGSSVYWAYTGMAPIAYLGVVSAFLNKESRNHNRWALLYILLQLAFLLLPVAGHVLHGFGYICNRWVFAWSFIVAFLFAREFPRLLTADRKHMALLSGTCIGYVLLCCMLDNSRSEGNLMGCVLLLISTILLYFTEDIKPFGIFNIRFSKAAIQKTVTVLLILIMVFQLSFYRYSFLEQDYLKEFRDAGTPETLLWKDRASVFYMIDDENFYRMDNSNTDESQANYPISSGQSTTAAYWSLLNPTLIDFLRENQIYRRMPHYNRGLSSRAWVQPLFCANYYTAGAYSSVEQALIPYGYELVGNEGNYNLYKTQNTLPFGYTYSGYLSEAEFRNLSTVQKQQAMLQSAVLPDDAAGFSLTSVTPAFTDAQYSYEVTCNNQAELQENSLLVKSPGGRLTLNCSIPGDGELYVHVTNLSYQSISSYDMLSVDEKAELSGYDRAVSQYKQNYWEPTDSTDITFACTPVETTATHYTDQNIFAESRSEYLMNLGYSKEPRNLVTITFSQPGLYTWDDISLILQPVSEIKPYTDSLKEDILENVDMHDNHISGTISLDQTKLLCMSLPFSKGWTARVDGEEAELIRTNIMFSGLMLEPGTHTIELSYQTPYLALGIGIGLLGLSGLLLTVWLKKKKAKV